MRLGIAHFSLAGLSVRSGNLRQSKAFPREPGKHMDSFFFFFLKKTFIKCQPYSQLCSLLYGNVLKEEGTVLHYKCPASMIFFVCQCMRRIHIKYNQLYSKSSSNQSISR